MQAFKRFFANLKLQYKLSISFGIIATVFFLVIMIAVFHEYSTTNLNAEKEKSFQAVSRAQTSLSSSLSGLFFSASKMLVEPEFKQTIQALQEQNDSLYTKNYQFISGRLGDFVSSASDLVDSAYLMSTDFTYGSEYSSVHKNPFLILDNPLYLLENVTYLPDSYNQNTLAGNVIPAVFPVSYNNSSGEAQIQYHKSHPNKNPVFFIYFINKRQVNNLLSRHATNLTSDFYLIDKDGRIINQGYSRIDPIDFQNLNQLVLESSELQNKKFKTSKDTLYISSRPLGIGGLTLVHIFSDTSITNSIRPMFYFLVFLWIGVLILFSVIATLIARFLTAPFRTLTEVIQKINQKQYNTKVTFKYKDESGMLGNQINLMYDTIQQQIEMIKQEEQSKAKAEIQMYSEQINPHFLYNTLECIHFQILNQNTDAAGMMLESLGKYLRITLSHGKTLIPLEKEIEHVTEYMNIINRHSSISKIQFLLHCSSNLTHLLILKLLLQPLTENAIKHGFPKDLSTYMLPPKIEISIQKQEAFLAIIISDNGEGIDVERAYACMNQDNFENGRHFGLRNVYKRLIQTYGSQATIKFNSIPYFMNTVTILVPWDKFESNTI